MADGRSLNKGVWKKGQSGNPKGRPKKGESLSEIVRAVLYQENSTGSDGLPRSVLDDMILALAHKAIEGDSKANEILLERGFGKATSVIEINHEQTFVFDWGDDSLLEGEVIEDDNNSIGELTDGSSS